MKTLLCILALAISSTGAFAQSEREAYIKASNAVMRANGADETERRYKALVQEFSDYRATLTDRQRDMASIAVAYAFIDAKDTAKANHYIAKLSDIPTLPTQLYGFAKTAQKNGLDIYALELLERTIVRYENLELAPDPKADPMGLANNREKYGVLFYTDYALALRQNGQAERGLAFAKKAYQLNKDDKAAIATYAGLLSDSKSYTEALPVMEAALLKGVADSAIRAGYKTAYYHVNGEKGYQEQLANLDQQQQEETRAELRGQMVSEPAADFSLQDLDGKTWSLADLKGKTVVLDFWATWCAPCKKSFPAMQMAINKYKGDASVLFLFIHTWERSPDATTEAKKFITDNSYDFHVLMDLKKGGTNEMVTKYEVQGIPAKFILDGKGNIRFKMTGFTGSDEAAVQELSAMIELAKTNL